MQEGGNMQQSVDTQTSVYPITASVTYPEKLSRLSTFFRLILAIPQWFAIYFVGIVAGISVFLAWWAIIFTGKYPQGLFDFVAGYLRWSTRVTGYWSLLTDKYPPFSLK
jgi:Domain of unknown function (DUF4389)